MPGMKKVNHAAAEFLVVPRGVEHQRVADQECKAVAASATAGGGGLGQRTRCRSARVAYLRVPQL
ncbi:MAG TPA: hypothetical protein VN442_09230 [Bryobacteraceae bacterium]|nr:hypothetical protein [Bryobacteraceae bacterium]